MPGGIPPSRRNSRVPDPPDATGNVSGNCRMSDVVVERRELPLPNGQKRDEYAVLDGDRQLIASFVSEGDATAWAALKNRHPPKAFRFPRLIVAMRRLMTWAVAVSASFAILLLHFGLPLPDPVHWISTLTSEHKFVDVLAAMLGVLAFSIWNAVDALTSQDVSFRSVGKNLLAIVTLFDLVFLVAVISQLVVQSSGGRTSEGSALWWACTFVALGWSAVLELVIAPNAKDAP